jgi:uncharacterized protein YecE (DUF72 family)
LIRLGTSTWTYEGWQGQIYQRQYAKSALRSICRNSGGFSGETRLFG